MADDLTIRGYRPSDDDERIWRLHEEAARQVDAYVEDADWDSDLADVQGSYLDDGGEFLLGFVDGTLVAMGALARCDETTAEVTRMRVDPDHQRRGYGTEILVELERRAAELGYESLVLETTERQVGARRLYESFGYERVDETEWREWTVHRYRKELSSRP